MEKSSKTIYVSAWAGVSQVESGVIVCVGFDYVEGLAVGLDGCPEFGIGGRLWGGLQDGDGLVIAEDFDRDAWRDELEGVIKVFAELGEGAWVERGGVKFATADKI